VTEIRALAYTTLAEAKVTLSLKVIKNSANLTRGYIGTAN